MGRRSVQPLRRAPFGDWATRSATCRPTYVAACPCSSPHAEHAPALPSAAGETSDFSAGSRARLLECQLPAPDRSYLTDVLRRGHKARSATSRTGLLAPDTGQDFGKRVAGLTWSSSPLSWTPDGWVMSPTERPPSRSRALGAGGQPQAGPPCPSRASAETTSGLDRRSLIRQQGPHRRFGGSARLFTAVVRTRNALH